MTWTAEAILALRVKAGLSQEAFAQAVGTSVSTVNRWEKGRVRPSRFACAALVKYALYTGTLYDLPGYQP